MKQLLLVFENTIIFWVILAILIIIFLYKRLDIAYHYIKPYRVQFRTEEWLRHFESTTGRDSSESMMRDLAKKQVLRKRVSSSLLKNICWWAWCWWGLIPNLGF